MKMDLKKVFATGLAVIMAVSMVAGCSSKNTSKPDDKKTIEIGCMPLNLVATQMIADGVKDYDIKVTVFDGNNLPAEALAAGETDCLLLNHVKWIDNFNKQNNSDLTLVPGYAYASVFGLYSYKWKSIDEIPNGAKIIVSNDPANMDRSLRLLEKVGLITLGTKTAEPYFARIDVKDNPRNLEIIEVETTNTAGSYKDADATIAFSSVMKNAGYDAKSYLAEDGERLMYATGIFVRKGNENSDWAKKMVDVTKTEEYQKKFDAEYQGAYVMFSEAELDQAGIND